MSEEHGKKMVAGHMSGGTKTGMAEHHVCSGDNMPHKFPTASGADRFRDTKNCGSLRVSGKSGAHMLGCKS